jgi:hypothetical protein
VKTLKGSVRVWLTFLLISSGFVCAIWADSRDPWGRKPGEGASGCESWFQGCVAGCIAMYGTGGSKGGDACGTACNNGLNKCLKTPNPATAGVGVNPTQSQPPNKQGPNPTATPRRLPIKGPPHRLGPSPNPSATAKPILLAKPASPTPSPKPTPRKGEHGHGHH